MHRISIIVLVGVFGATAAVAQSGVPGGAIARTGLSDRARMELGITDDEAATRFVEAYNAALDFQLAASADAFAEIARTWPDSPAGVYGMEAVALWRALMSEDDGAYDRFYALNDSLITLAESDARSAPRLAASAKLHRALAFGRQERYTRAGNSFREACGLFRGLD